jgi:ubiquinone/menaquinone biosynthesis C-methylase UbiE
MSLQDIENYRKAVSEVSRVLKLSGRFVFSIPHSCFEKIMLNGKKIDAASRYFEKAEYVIQWNMERLSIPFRTITFHRTLTDYFDAPNRNNLCIARLVEPRLTEKAHKKYPYLQDALQRPQSVIIESVKVAAS